jgi:hypothetical protein
MAERVEFKPPKGVVPEDVQAGDTFDLVTTYRLKKNGEVCLIQIGEQKMEGYEEDEYQAKEKPSRESYGNVMDSMHAAMGQGAGPDAGGMQ